MCGHGLLDCTVSDCYALLDMLKALWGEPEHVYMHFIVPN